MRYPYHAMLGLPFARLEVPGWGRVLRLLGVPRNELWVQAPTRTVRGKVHGYLMSLNLSDWSERMTYFLGRYAELPLERLIRAIVQPGESFVDVGANLGMVTLLAARCVGSVGRVHSFEPNPQMVQRLASSLEINAVKQVTLHDVALSDEPAELTLTLIGEHTGMATLAKVPEEQKYLTHGEYRVRVEKGDDVLPADLPGPVTIKIDVEGFECAVVRGLSATLDRFKPAVITEVIPAYLERAGGSAAELFEIFLGRGYQAFSLESRRSHLVHCLYLRPIASPEALTSDNVVWLHPQSAQFLRAQPWMAGSQAD